MNLVVTAENIDLTDTLRGSIDKKINKGLDKYLSNFNDEINTATLRLKKRSRWGYKVNLSMWLPGKKHIFAAARHEDLTLALVQLKKEVSRQIIDYLGRVSVKRRIVSY